MPVLPFLFDCSYKRKLGSIVGFCVSHAAIILIVGTIVGYNANSVNAAKRIMLIYMVHLSLLPVAQKRLHVGFYAVSLSSMLAGALGGVVLGLLPVAYLLRKPSNTNPKS